ncbi:DUF3043 domain-containing protein [Homoserinimonas sp. OAct 916]|uniref:DUF3043 domain-containing protein n=1 Tax=Homoserinimonas sp. OAct 916 TaxID=2211450 RepID=UPI000DBEA145|nr:DUF3043 domain-containing protein [Homoserinimonas sp. OAct 916]
MAKKTNPTNLPDPAKPEVPPTGKGAPTPTRKQQEAALMRPLVSGDRKQANKDARAKMSHARDRARVGMAAGEEKFLPERDKGAQRRFVRDWVDARFNVGEFMIPIMFVVIILTFLPDLTIQSVGILVLWIFFAAAVLDCIWLSMRVKAKIKERFKVETAQKGTAWYASMRALQLRVMRLPKPQVKRGQYPA